MPYRLAKTKYPYLMRDSHSGTFYVNAKIGGRLFRRALKIGGVPVKLATIAQIKAAEAVKLERERRKQLSIDMPQAEEGTFKAIADGWVKEIKASSLKPRAKDYRMETLGIVRKTWPGLDELKPLTISEAACKDWAARMAKQYSPGRFNGAVETLRAVFDRAMLRGHAVTNPAMAVARKPVRPKKRILPTAEELLRLLAALDRTPWRRRAARSFRFLLFCGARPSAAWKVRPKDVNLEKNEITFPPIKHQAEPLTVPMSADMRTVVEGLLQDHEGGKHPLLPIASCRKALKACCLEAGIAPLTPYAARHMFTTTLIEAGIPIPMVGAMRGDGAGSMKMMLDTYFHAHKEALHKEMAKIKSLVPAV